MGKAVIVSWVTVDEPGSSAVLYWGGNSNQKKKAKGKYQSYKFYSYTSGYIHHCTIRNLKASQTGILILNKTLIVNLVSHNR